MITSVELVSTSEIPVNFVDLLEYSANSSNERDGISHHKNESLMIEQ